MTLKTAFPAPTTKAISSPDSRSDLAGLVVRTTAGVPRAGILPRTTTALVSSRASMGVDVTAFEGVVVRTGLPSFIANDGSVTVPIGNAPVANSRYDVVYAKQNESSAPFSDGSDVAVFGYVSGTPSGSPSEAAAIALVPAGGLPLASILIPSTATTTQSGGVVINQLAPYTALTGGKIWVRNTTERDLVTGFAADQLALDLATGMTHKYNGSAWKAWASDWISYTPTLANITLGTGGTVTAFYRFDGAGVCQVRFKILLGTSGSMGTNPTMTLPVNQTTLLLSDQQLTGEIGYFDASLNGLLPGRVLTAGASLTTVRFYHTNTGAYTAVTATAPMPWAVGDAMLGSFEYVPA